LGAKPIAFTLHALTFLMRPFQLLANVARPFF